MGVNNDWPFVAGDCEVRLEPHVGTLRRSPATVPGAACGRSRVALGIRPTATLEPTIDAIVRARDSRTFPAHAR